MSQSGAIWTTKFPTETSLSALEQIFRNKVLAFTAAMTAAGATVHVSATRRPRQRAYLMHWSWCIWKAWQGTTPTTVPSFSPGPGELPVAIEWAHKNADGSMNLAASKAAAHAMVVGFQMSGLHTPPALNSNHIQGKALDMSIGWNGTISIKDGTGHVVDINTTPRNGTNKDLIKVGKTFGVIHFINTMADPPHWSWNGH